MFFYRVSRSRITWKWPVPVCACQVFDGSWHNTLNLLRQMFNLLENPQSARQGTILDFMKVILGFSYIDLFVWRRTFISIHGGWCLPGFCFNVPGHVCAFFWSHCSTRKTKNKITLLDEPRVPHKSPHAPQQASKIVLSDRLSTLRILHKPLLKASIGTITCKVLWTWIVSQILLMSIRGKSIFVECQVRKSDPNLGEVSMSKNINISIFKIDSRAASPQSRKISADHVPRRLGPHDF